MKPKLIFVEVDDTERYPPEISVLNVLSELPDYELHICSLSPTRYLAEFCKRRCIYLHDVGGVNVRARNVKGANFFKKVYDFFSNKHRLWNTITTLYQDGDLLWVNMYSTLRLLGRNLLNYKYVIHLFELTQDRAMHPIVPFLKLGLGEYLRNAYRVIVCEYNRACITKAWFGLSTLPVVLPNKMYCQDENLLDEYLQERIQKVLQRLQGKRIVLYQGILGPERPLGLFIQAVKELGDPYVMAVMSENPVDKAFKTNSLFEIGFIPPPYHLAITQKAHIGILHYQVSTCGYGGNDLLNTIYCAPNKIYEYSQYGLPMIGNDIPGLQYTIGQAGAGICIKNMGIENIKKAILEIEDRYEYYSKNSLAFYNSVDVKTIIMEEVLAE